MQPGKNIVILNWDGDGSVTPHPDPVFLNPNDSVSFQTGTLPAFFTGTPSVRVTFEPQTCLSRGGFEEGDGLGEIQVLAALPGPLHYDCELLLNGVPAPQKQAAAGGTGMPGGGGGGGGNLAAN